MIAGIRKFLDSSVSCYHATANIVNILEEKGFKRLNENMPFNLEFNSKYYLVRNDSAVIAFTTPKQKTLLGMNITASHSDSPTFKLKSDCLLKKGPYTCLNLEVYGGPIFQTWLDRPLSIAGRVIVCNGTKIQTKLVYLDEDLLVIPNVPPHLNPSVSRGTEYNARIDMPALLAVGEESLIDYLAKKSNIAGQILSHDLFLVNRQRSTLLGINKEMLMSPQLDDLASAYTSLMGFVNSDNKDSFNIYCCFDNEEVGSRTKQGAASNFLINTIKRALGALNYSNEEIEVCIANSFITSVDNAHAVNPNHFELFDLNNAVYLNSGVVVKYNANQSYTTDALAASYFKVLANKAECKLQEYANRSDIRGGGTLGAISSSQVSIHSIDIGLPQLAMHSSTEVCGVNDLFDMEKLIREFYNCSIRINADNEIEMCEV